MDVQIGGKLYIIDMLDESGQCRYIILSTALLCNTIETLPITCLQGKTSISIVQIPIVALMLSLFALPYMTQKLEEDHLRMFL